MREQLHRLAEEAKDMTNRQAWQHLQSGIYSLHLEGKIAKDDIGWAKSTAWEMRRDVRKKHRSK